MMNRRTFTASLLSAVPATSLVGTKTTATFDNHRPRVAVWADVEPWAAPQRDPEDPMAMWGGPKKEIYVAQTRQSWIAPSLEQDTHDAEYFVDCVETGQRPVTDGARSLQSLRVIWRLYEAEQRGTVADLRGLGLED